MRAAALGLALALATGGCSPPEVQASPPPPPVAPPPSASSPANPTGMPPGLTHLSAPVWSYRVVARYPHDPGAFTEGLLVSPQGTFYESTGQNGESRLREVEIKTGKVLREKRLDGIYFGEGLAQVGERLFQMTWQNGIGFIYRAKDFKNSGTFKLDREGWGLTTDHQHRLIMSDGTNRLSIRDPNGFKEIKEVDVHEGASPIRYVNELEMYGEDLLANVWTTDYIAVIDPSNGNVKAWVDMGGLLSSAQRAQVDVLNGIAYDAANNRLFVTGKYWPTMFQIEIQKK